VGNLTNATRIVSLSLRLKVLLGPVTRVKKRKKKKIHAWDPFQALAREARQQNILRALSEARREREASASRARAIQLAERARDPSWIARAVQLAEASRVSREAEREGRG